MQPFEEAIEFYNGTDSDGAWSEGSRDGDAYVSAVPPGNYTLRLEAQWANMTQPTTMQVRIEEAGPRLSHFLILLLALLDRALDHDLFSRSFRVGPLGG